MKCSCEAEISARSKFCPYCGSATAPELAQLETFILAQSKETFQLSQLGSQQLVTGAGVTVTLRDSNLTSYLPVEYRALLQAEVVPDLIRELFTRIIELRELLEAMVKRWPEGVAAPLVKRAEVYLRTHCIYCGSHINLAENSTTPVCVNCPVT